jgi:hypothetical protein
MALKKQGKHNSRKGHTAICEHEKQHSTVRKPRLPPARSLEITQCEPRQHLTDCPSHANIQKPAMTLPCGNWKVKSNGEKKCEPDLICETEDSTQHSEPPQSFVYPLHNENIFQCQIGHHSEQTCHGPGTQCKCSAESIERQL